MIEIKENYVGESNILSLTLSLFSCASSDTLLSVTLSTPLRRNKDRVDIERESKKKMGRAAKRHSIEGQSKGEGKRVRKRKGREKKKTKTEGNEARKRKRRSWMNG